MLGGLEDRWCPSAVINYDGTNLTIRTRHSAKRVHHSTAANTFKVSVGVSNATYSITGNVSVTTGNSDDNVSFDTSGSASLATSP